MSFCTESRIETTRAVKFSRFATSICRRTRSRRSYASCLRSRSPRQASSIDMRNVIVTGGSRGLGLAIVRKIVCEGYHAIAVARQMNDSLARTIEEVERSNPGALHFVPFDLGEVQQIPDLAKTLRK